jgi:hypothetical protein
VELNKGPHSAAQTHSYQEEMPVSVTVQDNICKHDTLRRMTGEKKNLKISNVHQNSEQERLNATTL